MLFSLAVSRGGPSAGGWWHVLADGAAFLACVALGALLVCLAARGRDRRFRRLLWLASAFLFASGLVQAVDALAFWVPAGPLPTVAALAVAVVSWAALLALVPLVPRLLAR